eukprot:TRINITY_DN11755_c0_g2_i2.p1 TRINITY_DN11755_c0_g2~~TRINITY_DN11755_c0_g2_i2.p1  ORF type:complete len:418 (+),score=92.58 TRINITY_DN11755_c0_g2_i2:57-1310(+)
MKILATLALLLVLGTVAHAKYIQGTVKVNTDFVYIDRFVFDNRGNGTLDFTIMSSDPNAGNFRLALYNDVDRSIWLRAYENKENMNCEQRLALANGIEPITLSTPSTIIFEDIQRPHYWWFVITNCGSSSTELDYQMHFYNSGPSLWTKEFSFDIQGLEGLFLFYFLAYLVGGALHGYAVWVLIRSRSYHPIVRILSIVIGLEGLYVFCHFVHLAAYSHNGVGAEALAAIGNFLEFTAQVFFISLLILIAKGWAITKTTLEDKRINIVIAAVLGAGYLALFIWMYAAPNTALSLYMYDSVAGVILVVLRVLAMFYFLWCLRTTVLEENHPTKRRFYLIFGVAYLIWFLMLPLIVSIAAGLAKNEPWMMSKSVTGLYVTTNAVALAGLAYLLWPTRANEYFQISSHLDIAGTIPYDTI